MANKTVVTAEPGKQELFITREFDAPRELVFKAHTDPDLYAKWVGPHGMTMTIEKWEMHDGGSYNYTHERDGHKYSFFGVTHEVHAPERIIGTFEFDGLPERGHVILGITSFEELPDGRSRVVHQSVFRSVADRDGMVRSGMEGGVRDGYEKLDNLLVRLQEPNTASA
ncbi:MAG TPA: SRPBCC family protein [Pyrinomonadaceae bacterium]|nr:SRPBCC family protein [Pyrinomonadaceae bacterium]